MYYAPDEIQWYVPDNKLYNHFVLCVQINLLLFEAVVVDCPWQTHLFVAIQEFDGEQDGDLSFKEGDVLTVIDTRYRDVLFLKLELTLS